VEDVTAVADVEYVDPRRGGRGWFRESRSRRRHTLTASVSVLLGEPVGVAVPLQRRQPSVIFASGLAEVAALVAFVLSAQSAFLIVLAVLAATMVGLAVGNGRRILAVTSRGVVVLAASSRGRPVAVIDVAPEGLQLPPPAGLGVPLVLRGQTWWVERSGFPRLRRARELLRADEGPLATEGGSPESSS
jgi:hypothetical protein